MLLLHPSPPGENRPSCVKPHCLGGVIKHGFNEIDLLAAQYVRKDFKNTSPAWLAHSSFAVALIVFLAQRLNQSRESHTAADAKGAASGFRDIDPLDCLF